MDQEPKILHQDILICDCKEGTSVRSSTKTTLDVFYNVSQLSIMNSSPVRWGFTECLRRL